MHILLNLSNIDSNIQVNTHTSVDIKMDINHTVNAHRVLGQRLILIFVRILMRTVIVILKIIFALAKLPENKNTTTCTDMDAVNNTDHVQCVCLYCRSLLLRINLKSLFSIVTSVAVGPGCE